MVSTMWINEIKASDSKLDIFLKKYFSQIFSLDLRSLALFRVALGTMLLLDLALRCFDVVAHVTDSGVLSRELLWQLLETKWRFSLYFVSGTPAWSFFLFGLSALSALCFLLGWKTRFFNILSWILLVSLHVRNPFLLDGGDHLLRYLLFWGLFLPLGKRASLDSIMAKEKTIPREVLSVGSAGLILQVCLAYWFAAYLKSLTPEWNTGQAVEISLGIVGFVKPLGHLVSQWPSSVLREMTEFIFNFEKWGPVLFLMPIFFSFFRLAGVIAFTVTHLFFAALLDLGMFPWIDIIAVLPFLPARFWERTIQKDANDENGGLVTLKASIFMNVVAGFFLALIFFWNLWTSSSTFRMPQGLMQIGYLTHMDQRWGMYAPPSSYRSWIVVPARFKDGTETDLANFENPKNLNWQEPDNKYSLYQNARWRNYLLNIAFNGREKARTPYLDFLYKKWSSSPERKEISVLGMFILYQYFFPQVDQIQIVKLDQKRFDSKDNG